MNAVEQRRKLRRLLLSAADLSQARRLVEHVLKHKLYREKDQEQRIVSRGLQVAAIVSYSRPFSGNYDFPHTVGRLSEEYLHGLNEKQRLLHARILSLRDKSYAHTDADVADLNVDIIDWFGSSQALASRHNPFASLPVDEWQRFLTVIINVDAAVFEAIERLQDAMRPGDSF